MNEIQRLIHEMCPDGVPMVALGEIGSLIRGNGLQKKDFVDQGIGCIHYGQIYTRFGLFTDKTLAYVSESLANKLTQVESGNLVIACTSENVEDVCKCVAWLGDKTIVTGGHAVVFKHSQNPKYIAYCFTSEDFQTQKRKYAFGAKVIDIKIDKLASIQIPLPPLPIQQRIVEILDKFTSLVSSLDSEIALRQKQYEYYRNKLLSFEGEDIEYKKLGEVCDTLSGFPFDSSKFTNEGIRLMRGMNIKRGYLDFSEDLNRYWQTSQNLEKYLLEDNDIVMSMDGSLVGKSFATIEKKHLPLILVQRVARIRSTKIDTHYVYQCIKYNFSDYVDKKKTGGAIPHISMKDIDNFIIPFPPLDRQLSIVRTLDTFESLLTNLKKERELHQKQYEYYREKLLTFA